MRILIIILLGALAATAYAEVYKWVDADGRVHYSDLPQPHAQNARQTKTKANIIETETQPFATKIAAQKNPIMFFSFDDCGSACNQAQAFLEKRGVPYKLKNSEADRAELKKLTGDMQVPVLVVGKQTPRVGYEETTWSRMLDTAGYPKSNPLGGKSSVQQPLTSVPPAKSKLPSALLPL